MPTASFSKPGPKLLASSMSPSLLFEFGFGVSHSVSHITPALLYVLNSSGLPYSPRASESSNSSFRTFRQLQAQFDALQQKVDTGARAFESEALTLSLSSKSAWLNNSSTTRKPLQPPLPVSRPSSPPPHAIKAPQIVLNPSKLSTAPTSANCQRQTPVCRISIPGQKV